MIIREEYDITIRKDVTCQAGARLIEYSKGFGSDTVVPVKLVIGKEAKNGQYPVYLDEEKPENMVGKIQEIKSKDGEVMDGTDIELLAKDGNYNIVLKGQLTSPFEGKLQILKDEASANKAGTEETDEKLALLVQEKIDAGVITKEEAEKRIAFMRENYVDSFTITRTVKDWKLHNKPAHKPSCLYVDPYLEETRNKKQEGIIAEGLRAAAGRQALILEGEKSTGKNVYTETIAWLRYEPQYLITFSRQMSPASIYGEKTTDNSAAKELAEFDPEILERAERIRDKIKFSMNLLYKTGIGADEAMSSAMESLVEEEREVLKREAEFKKLKAQSSSVNIIIDASELYDWLIDGGTMVFNELNMCDANFFASFTNQLLDGTGFLFVPGRGEVPINRDCVLFGTQNAEYAGTEMQNEATMSRFGCLYFKQPESIKKQLMTAVEAALKRDGFEAVKLDKKFFNETESFYKQCRSAVRKQTVSNACLNIRGFVRALTAVAEGDGYCNLKRQIEIHVVNTCPFDERQALYATLENIVTL